MSILAIALTVGALVIIYMACALSYRQIERACARRRVVARLKSSRWRAALEEAELQRQINIDARAECDDGCGCGNWRAHADHIRQDEETMRLYRGEGTDSEGS